MKKFKGTKFAHIGTSYTPALDAEIAKVEAMVMAQQARLMEITERVEDLLGTDLEHWGE
jgi:hypothetical protein